MTESGVFPRLFFALFAMAGAFCAYRSAGAQGSPDPTITSPADGDYAKGQIDVKGGTDLPYFSSAELAFAYEPDPTGAWFTISVSSLPVTDGVIGTWDTTAITDGDYILRLRVTLLDGSIHDATVTLKVRNYTPMPTPSAAVTPTPTAALLIPTPIIIVASETPSAQPLPPAATPTALPPNPAGVTPAEVFARFWRGALVVGVLVLALGALVRLRR